MVDLNVTWLGFVFILNSFVCFSFHSFLEKMAEDGGGVRLELDVQGQGGRTILDVDRQGGGESRKLNNFHGRQ